MASRWPRNVHCGGSVCLFWGQGAIVVQDAIRFGYSRAPCEMDNNCIARNHLKHHNRFCAMAYYISCRDRRATTVPITCILLGHAAQTYRVVGARRQTSLLDTLTKGCKYKYQLIPAVSINMTLTHAMDVL